MAGGNENMNKKAGVFIEVLVYFIVVILLTTMAYQQGESDGMKKLCTAGTLYEYEDGVIKCVVDYEEVNSLAGVDYEFNI